MTGDIDDSAQKKNEGGPDVNSPLYIHAYDYPKQMHVNETLTDNNYADWSHEMMNFLLAKNKVCFVNGSINKPGKDSSDYMPWMRCDAMVKGWLTTEMDEIRTSVKYAKTTLEIWADLKEQFRKKSAPRPYKFKQKISMTHHNGVTISVYYTKLRSLWDDIESVLLMPRCSCNKCTCDVGKKLSGLKEKERLYEFLIGLDNHFSDERQRAILADKKPATEAAAFRAYPRDVEIERLQQRIRDLEIQQESPNEETESEPHGWDVGGDEDHNPFGNFRQNFQGPNREDPLCNMGMKIEIPEFKGKVHPDEFIDWLSTVERIFDLRDIPDHLKVKLVAIKLQKYASLWWDHVKKQRLQDGKSKVKTWPKMKKLLQEKFLPVNY
ncbi:putative retrotransposon copia-like protein [Tanacetum coccineum]